MTGHEIALKVGIPKTNVYRALENFELLGFATYEESQEGYNAIRRYSLSKMMMQALDAVYDFDEDGKATRKLVRPFLQEYTINNGVEIPIPCKNPRTPQTTLLQTFAEESF